jgi:large repetitive protein
MDTRRTKRKYPCWIASAGLVALLVGPSAVGAQPCVITFPGAPPSGGTVGMAYEQGISGSSPYLLIFYSVTAGTLPPGLNLTQFGNETWRIVGTPTATGRFTFTITATNGPNGSLCSGEITYSINIAAPVPTLPQWATIALVGMLGVAGVTTIRKRMT